LQEILRLPEWIIEGVYHQWLNDSFRLADTIIVLTPSVFLRDWRILRRFAMRKLGLARGKREALKDLFALLRWNHRYDGDNLKRALSALEPYRSKMIVCRSASAAIRSLTGRSQQSAPGDAGKPVA
jgi:hypothetical protein